MSRSMRKLLNPRSAVPAEEPTLAHASFGAQRSPTPHGGTSSHMPPRFARKTASSMVVNAIKKVISALKEPAAQENFSVAFQAQPVSVDDSLDAPSLSSSSPSSVSSSLKLPMLSFPSYTDLSISAEGPFICSDDGSSASPSPCLPNAPVIPESSRHDAGHCLPQASSSLLPPTQHVPLPPLAHPRPQLHGSCYTSPLPEGSPSSKKRRTDDDSAEHPAQKRMRFPELLPVERSSGKSPFRPPTPRLPASRARRSHSEADDENSSVEHSAQNLPEPLPVEKRMGLTESLHLPPLRLPAIPHSANNDHGIGHGPGGSTGFLYGYLPVERRVGNINIPPLRLPDTYYQPPISTLPPVNPPISALPPVNIPPPTHRASLSPCVSSSTCGDTHSNPIVIEASPARIRSSGCPVSATPAGEHQYARHPAGVSHSRSPRFTSNYDLQHFTAGVSRDPPTNGADNRWDPVSAAHSPLPLHPAPSMEPPFPAPSAGRSMYPTYYKWYGHVYSDLQTEPPLPAPPGVPVVGSPIFSQQRQPGLSTLLQPLHANLPSPTPSRSRGHLGASTSYRQGIYDSPSPSYRQGIYDSPPPSGGGGHDAASAPYQRGMYDSPPPSYRQGIHDSPPPSGGGGHVAASAPYQRGIYDSPQPTSYQQGMYGSPSPNSVGGHADPPLYPDSDPLYYNPPTGLAHIPPQPVVAGTLFYMPYTPVSPPTQEIVDRDITPPQSPCYVPESPPAREMLIPAPLVDTSSPSDGPRHPSTILPQCTPVEPPLTSRFNLEQPSYVFRDEPPSAFSPGLIERVSAIDDWRRNVTTPAVGFDLQEPESSERHCSPPAVVLAKRRRDEDEEEDEDDGESSLSKRVRLDSTPPCERGWKDRSYVKVRKPPTPPRRRASSSGC